MSPGQIEPESLSPAWALRIGFRHAEKVARFRLEPGMRVGRTESDLWLRATQRAAELQRQLRALPGATLYHLRADGTLIPWGQTVPTAKLPQCAWLPLATEIAPKVELTSPPPAAVGRVGITLKVQQSAEPARVLLTTKPDWLRFAGSAPALRLADLLVAFASTAEVLVWGTPLPPIAGERFSENGGIATPLGTTWFPPVGAEELRQLFRLAPGDIALLDRSGGYQRIEATMLRPAVLCRS